MGDAGPVPSEAGSRWLDQLLRDLDTADNLLIASRRFEAVVLTLIRAEAASTADGNSTDAPGVEVQMRSPNSRLRIRFDAVLPNGLADLPGPVVVETRYFSGRDKRLTSHRLREMLRSRALEASFYGAGAALIVQNLPIDRDLAGAVELEIQLLQRALQDPPQIVVWGADELSALADKHAGALLNMEWPAALRPPRVVPEALEATPQYVEARKEALQELYETYSSDGISLFIGAGVSMGFGLPSWTEILASLYRVALQDQLSANADEVDLRQLERLAGRLTSDSPLQAARFVQRALAQSGERFEERLTEVLYRTAEPDRQGTLLSAVSDLCMATRRGSRVHSVVTYNFDDLLEYNLTNRRVRALSIFEAKGAPTVDDLPVYHVHGFLPRDRANYATIADEQVVFAEQQYHILYTEPYHWTNIVQLNAIREHTCVFLGLSMTDPNLRRLLEIGSRSAESARHYALMKRRTRVELIKEDRNLRDLSTVAMESFLAWYHQLSEEVLRDLGVRVLWFDDYDDIRDAIQALADQ